MHLVSKRINDMKKYIKIILSSLFVILCLGAIFHQQITGLLIKYYANKAQQTTVASVKRPKPDYDPSSVEYANIQDALNAWKHVDELNHTGQISIPDVEINIPIFPGLNKWNLLAGAGEQEPHDIVKNGGKGNYILASHHMMDYGLLFSNLSMVEPGMTVYTTDTKNIYEYNVLLKQNVSVDDTTLINIDAKDKSLITLYTCVGANNTLRTVVHGELAKTIPLDKATDDEKSVFQTQKGVYPDWLVDQYLSMGY